MVLRRAKLPPTKKWLHHDVFWCLAGVRGAREAPRIGREMEIGGVGFLLAMTLLSMLTRALLLHDIFNFVFFSLYPVLACECVGSSTGLSFLSYQHCTGKDLLQMILTQSIFR